MAIRMDSKHLTWFHVAESIPQNYNNGMTIPMLMLPTIASKLDQTKVMLEKMVENGSYTQQEMDVVRQNLSLILKQDLEQKAVFLPFRGEFGSLLINHAPRVYGYRGYKIVYHEKGYDPFYPDANERYMVDSVEEGWRSASGARTDEVVWKEIMEKHGPECAYYYPTKMDGMPGVKFRPKRVKDTDYKIDFDILVFPRQKDYAGGRNLTYWGALIDGLQRKGYKVLAAGKPDASASGLSCKALYNEVDDFTDATIWAIEKAGFILTTVSAGALLSLSMGKPPYIIIDERGANPDSGFEYGMMQSIDVHRVGWTILSHWNDPDWLLAEICHYKENPVDFNRWRQSI